MTDTIETRVARGVALLGEKAPAWANMINLDLLDLSSECRCVLGQAWGGDEAFDPYWAAVEELFPEDADADGQAVAHGFDSRSGDLDFDELTAEWRRVIEARRSAT